MEESSVNHIEENTEIRIPSLSDCNKEGHHKSKEEDTVRMSGRVFVV